jgi:ectoine hydroxylase-related dioxygenase (phytanoyl-CoA dioxygenase family)
MNMSSPPTLPSLDDHRLLPHGLADNFRRDGHTVVRGLASPEEVADFREHILAACDRLRYETRPLAERDTYGRAFLQYWGLAAGDEVVRRFVMARRFARVAAELLGVDGVRLYHDQALLKEPGGGPTPMHQDQHYWPMQASAVTMWMPLVPVPTEVGSMSFVSGSHALGYLGEFDISDASELAVRQLVGERGLSAATHGAMEPGDATFHAGWTLHSAPNNPSDKVREVMTVIYISADAKMTKPKAWQRGDTDLWFQGLSAGDAVAGPMHPVIWQR